MPNEIVLGALNVVATPHPEGIYVQILRGAANKTVPIWGTDFGKITAPRVRRDEPTFTRAEF